MTDRERVYSYLSKECDYTADLMNKIKELKRENVKIKQRVAELEKTKKKRKFRAITNGEICRKWKEIHTFCRIGKVACPFFGVVDCRPRDFKAKPFQTKYGKYILIEVKE